MKTTKICTKCKQSKNLSEFGKDCTAKSGYKFRCKECINIDGRKRDLIRNKTEKRKAQRRIWDNTPEAIAKRCTNEYKKKAADRAKTPAAKLQKKEYAKSEHARELQRINRQTEISQQKRKNYMSKPKSKLAKVLSENKRRAIKKSAEDGTVTPNSVKMLLIEQNNKCFHCNKELDNTKHLDHYIPLSKGGPHSINNVVWSCAICNIRKSNTMPTKLMI